MSEKETAKKYDIDSLRWLRVFSPVHIPKYLVEQIKDREFSVEEFYKYHEINCLVEEQMGPTFNPFHHLWVLADDNNLVKGFLWFVIDALSKSIVVNTFSIDNKYWFGGKAMKKASDHIKNQMKNLKINKVYWITNYPRHSERAGFRRSKSTIMEYTEEENGKNTSGGHTEKKEHRDADTRTAAAV